jgi:hypothetical protein
VRSTVEEVSVLTWAVREQWRMTVVGLPLATREEVDDEADRRDSCLSAAEAEGHKAIYGLASVGVRTVGVWLPSYLGAARGHDCA